ncbi:hypothetical protein LJC18_02175 [Lachnospiraceae bacterium OttesenSCG-928-E19]|nr:hypothetical protein [Lachnospiraceae bacterium OttesenSCG-928-E19]
MSKTMKIIFILSVVLNALLAGLFAGHMIQSHRMRPATHVVEIRNDMRRPVREQRIQLFRVMRADPYDAVKFNVALDAWANVQCEFNRQYMIHLNDKLQKMDPRERADALDKMMRRGPGQMPHRHK